MNYPRPVAAVLMLSSFFFFACDKDDNNSPTLSIEGTWQGDKLTLQGYPDGFPAPVLNETDDDFDGQITFKTDGTVTVNIDDTENTGTWTWVEENKKQFAILTIFI